MLYFHFKFTNSCIDCRKHLVDRRKLEMRLETESDSRLTTKSESRNHQQLLNRHSSYCCSSFYVSFLRFLAQHCSANFSHAIAFLPSCMLLRSRIRTFMSFSRKFHSSLHVLESLLFCSHILSLFVAQ